MCERIYTIWGEGIWMLDMAIQVTTNLICNEKWVSLRLQFISTYTYLFVCLLRGRWLEPPKPPRFVAPDKISVLFASENLHISCLRIFS